MNFRVITILAATLALGVGIYVWTKPEKSTDRRAGKKRPMTVSVQLVTPRAVPLTLETVGSVEAERSVEVRAQVSGLLKRALFTEGQLVRTGDLLLEIEPGPFRTALEQAEAALTRDRAQAKNAKAQFARLKPLLGKDYITRGEYDQARALAASSAATVAADEAAVEKARIDLSYTQIRAPIDGRSGNLLLKPGNLVSINTPLVTINQLQPVLLRFAITQLQLETVRRYQADGNVVVEARAESPNGRLLEEGPLVFIDNNINAQTGTVVLKARLVNLNEALLPGQFVGVRMILAVEPARVVVSESALQTGQDGQFVYLLIDGKAQMQKVKVNRQVGSDFVISEGLSGGESLIVRFPRELVPGAVVSTETKTKSREVTSEPKSNSITSDPRPKKTSAR